MSHVLNWWSLSNDEIKEFLEVNDIRVPSTMKFTIDRVDQLYRGELKEGIIITDPIIELEKEYGIELRQLYDKLIQDVFQLEYDEVLKFCESDEIMAKVCEETEFWKYWFHKRTSLDVEFFIPFDKEGINNLREAYEEYLNSGDFSKLERYKDIMNHIFLNTFIKMKKYIPPIDWFALSFIKFGGLLYLKYSVEDLGNYPYRGVLNDAALSGDLESVKYLITKFVPNENTLINVVESDNLELMKYLMENYRDLLANVDLNRLSRISIREGNLEILEYLIYQHDIVYEENDYVIQTNYTIMSGDLKLIKEQNVEPNNEFLRVAVKSENLEMIEYFADGIANLNKGALRIAIESCNLEIVRYLLEKYNPRFNKNRAHYILKQVIESGSLEILKYLIEEYKIKVSEDLVIDAIRNNKINIWMYLVEELEMETIPETITLLDIVQSNNLSILKYISGLGKINFNRENLEYVNKMFTCVINNANLGMLRYLIEEYDLTSLEF